MGQRSPFNSIFIPSFSAPRFSWQVMGLLGQLSASPSRQAFGLAFRDNAAVSVEDIHQCLLPDADGENVCSKLLTGVMPLDAPVGQKCASTCVADHFFNTASWGERNGTFINIATRPDPWTAQGNKWLLKARDVSCRFVFASDFLAEHFLRVDSLLTSLFCFWFFFFFFGASSTLPAADEEGPCDQIRVPSCSR
jgi:hypothetical protein